MPAGRPMIFRTGKRQLNVLVSIEDYRSLRELARAEREERPGFSLGDLLRGFIRRGLEENRRGHHEAT
jgi:hypothetical protein